MAIAAFKVTVAMFVAMPASVEIEKE